MHVLHRLIESAISSGCCFKNFCLVAKLLPLCPQDQTHFADAEKDCPVPLAVMAAFLRDQRNLPEGVDNVRGLIEAHLSGQPFFQL